MKKINILLILFLSAAILVLLFVGSVPGIFNLIIQNIISGTIGAIIFVNIVNRVFQIEEERRILKTQKVVIGMLIKAINEFLFFTAQQIKAASDRWLPRNIDEMYSDESLLVIGQHLDISKDAPITLKESWRDYISRKAADFLEAIDSALKFHSFYLSDELISALDRVHSSPIIYLYKIIPNLHLIDLQWKTARAPKIGLMPHNYGIFWKDIRSLIKIVETEQNKITRKENFQSGFEIKFPGNILNPMNLTPRLGKDRIE
ncbi:MAG: hypothetical protein NT145_03975 [Elusimicrobia bacterium]|nr:hypothetical protein [Elusimicrobiota bacterium]